MTKGNFYLLPNVCGVLPDALPHAQNMRHIYDIRQAYSGFSLIYPFNTLRREISISVPITAMSTEDNASGSLILEKQTSKTKPPPLYQVILLNDDYTPMEFVVHVLQKYFNKGHEEAMRIMLTVHHEGRGVCGVYPQDVAATRIHQVLQFARSRQHPLQCVMEPVGD